MTRTAAALLVLVAAGAAWANGTVTLSGAGGLDPVASSPADGEFRITSKIRRDGRETARVEVDAFDVDATRGPGGELPEFRVHLVAPGGGATADLGRMDLNRRGRARLRVADARKRLPASAPTLRAFEGGVIEVRREGAAALRGDVPRLAFDGAGQSLAVRRVFGEFEALAKLSGSRGDYLLEVREPGTSAPSDRILVNCPSLPTSPNAAGVRPDYRVFLITDGATRQVDLGSMKLDLRLGAALSLDQTAAPFPGGIGTVEEFGGGRIEVRRANVVLLRGEIVPFPRLADAGLLQRDASARAGSELAPVTAGDAARAVVRTRLGVSPGVRRQAISVRLLGLPAGPHTVVAVHPGGTRTTIGTAQVPSPLGWGEVRADTRRAGGLPGGDLLWLAGQDLEVLGPGGDVVLTGVVPRF